MVIEREPPKATLSPQKPSQQQPQPPPVKLPQQPEFGKASPLRSRLESATFNIPKPHQARPEHHRPIQVGSQSQTQQYLFNPSGQSARQQPAPRPYSALGKDADLVEIPKPTNYPAWTRPEVAPAPLFSSQGGYGGFTAINPASRPADLVDLTTEPALFDDRFGAANPYEYIDAAKANENIKALLEGAFEDADEKPRTRGRKKKVEAAVEGLTDKLQGLEVKSEDKKEIEPEVEEEDEHDGSVEGLNVKLLPHQVDGVDWMTDKESRMKKKNGVLPKGGILADDVSGTSFAWILCFLTLVRWVLVKRFSQSP